MYAKVNSLGVAGLNGYTVQVETDLSGGLPQFTMAGLPASAVKESSERVRSALKNLHYQWPASRITVNLAPADVRKTGPVYDLPVFISIMAARGKLPAVSGESAFLGELGLDGTLRPVNGVLPMALVRCRKADPRRADRLRCRRCLAGRGYGGCARAAGGTPRLGGGCLRRTQSGVCRFARQRQKYAGQASARNPAAPDL